MLGQEERLTVRDRAVLREWQPVDAGVKLVAPIIP
jgi:hypothetical protein